MQPFLDKTINFKNYAPLGALVFAHWMPWFGSPDHKNIPGYDSRDIATCDRQVAQMKSMGIDGINVDFYGPLGKHAFHNLATRRMLDACERGGLLFSLGFDEMGNTAAEYVSAMQYTAETYFPSSAYWTVNGQPVVTFFGSHADDAKVDFAALKLAGDPYKPLFVFENSGGFTHAQSDGAFGWITLNMVNGVQTLDPDEANYAYINNFRKAVAANPMKIALPVVYPGFDDSQATWTQKRLMNRRGGATLLDTLSWLPAATKYVMICTWNDHEEGSGIELSLS